MVILEQILTFFGAMISGFGISIIGRGASRKRKRIRLGALTIGPILLVAGLFNTLQPPPDTSNAAPAEPDAATTTEPALPVTPLTGDPPSMTAVPDLFGLDRQMAAQVLQQADLQLGTAQAGCAMIGSPPPTDPPEPDTIMCQSPLGGSMAPTGTTVDYVLAVPLE
jgi:hypothetical protein